MIRIITVLLVFISVASVQAQRLIPGQWNVELKYGYVQPLHENSFTVQGGINQYLRNGNYISYSGAYEKTCFESEIKDIPIETYFAEIGFHKSLFTNRSKSLLFYVGMSAIGGYRIYNDGNKLLEDSSVIIKNSTFVFGGALNGSIETFISDHWMLVLIGKLKFINNIEETILIPGLQFGIKYNFKR